jgi:hypothetical protein
MLLICGCVLELHSSLPHHFSNEVLQENFEVHVASRIAILDVVKFVSVVLSGTDVFSMFNHEITQIQN